MYKVLKDTRNKMGYSINDMANVIDKSPCNYYKKEMGKVVFSVTEAIKIAEFLKKRVEFLFHT